LQNLNGGLVSACQLQSLRSKINILDWHLKNVKDDLVKAKSELDSSKAALVLSESKLGSAREAAKAAQGKVVGLKKELDAKKLAMENLLKKNEELAASKEAIQGRLSEAAIFFFGKGRIDAMKEPVEVRSYWNPDQDLEELNAAHPELAKLNAVDEVDSPGSQEKRATTMKLMKKRRRNWMKV